MPHRSRARNGAARFMKIRLKFQYMQWEAGSVVDLPTGTAKTLVEFGRAFAVPEEVEAKRLQGPPRNKAVKATTGK